MTISRRNFCKIAGLVPFAGIPAFAEESLDDKLSRYGLSRKNILHFESHENVEILLWFFDNNRNIPRVLLVNYSFQCTHEKIVTIDTKYSIEEVLELYNKFINAFPNTYGFYSKSGRNIINNNKTFSERNVVICEQNNKFGLLINLEYHN